MDLLPTLLILNPGEIVVKTGGILHTFPVMRSLSLPAVCLLQVTTFFVQTLSAQDVFFRTDSVTVSAVGDIMAHQTQITSAWNSERECYDFGPVFTYTVDLLSQADITLGNFETTLPGVEEMYTGYPAFGAPDALASALKDAGFDLFNTANNHCCDKGRLGLTRTLDVLDRLQLLHVGTYRNEAEYEKNRVLFIERNRLKLAFMGYTYGTNGINAPQGTVVSLLDTALMAADVRLALLGNPDFIIAIVHFGTEYLLEPDSGQAGTVDFLFKQGVDVVLGGHPHVLQGFELENRVDQNGEFKPRLVVYSLGNFLSNQAKPHRDGGIILNFTLKKTVDVAGFKTGGIGNVHYFPVWVFNRYRESPNRFLLVPWSSFFSITRRSGWRKRTGKKCCSFTTKQRGV